MQANENMVRQSDSKIVGVIDLGSNSVRMNIVQIYPNGVTEILKQSKEMVQLGHGAFFDNVLQESAMQRTLEVLKDFARQGSEAQVGEYLAVATSAVRDAANGKEFLEKICLETGIPFASVSGIEEARLIYKGISQNFEVSDTLRLYFDIGGGSSEFIVGDSYTHRVLDSVKIGCVRMANMFMADKHGTVSEPEYRQLQNYVRLEASHTFGRLSSYPIKEMVVSSGTVQCLLDIARGMDEESIIQENFISYKTLCKIVRLLCSMTEEERKNIAGMNPKRANIIIPGAAILQTVMEELGFSGCFVSPSGLRDGLLRDYLEKHYPHFNIQNSNMVQETSVFKLARSAKFEEQHARHVAYLALRFFDSAKGLGLHSINEQDRHHLYFAAILHDIGIAIAFTGHDEHGRYIVQHYAGLLGFTEEKRKEIALLVGSHRMREDKKIWDDPKTDNRRKSELAFLALCLKLAESLDRSHNQYIEDIFLKKENGRTDLHVVCTVPACVEQEKVEEGRPFICQFVPDFGEIVWEIKA